jgi:hypothetical protein
MEENQGAVPRRTASRPPALGPRDGAPPGTEAAAASRDVSPGVAAVVAAVQALVAEGVLPMGLDAGDRPTADVQALLVALAQVEAVLAMRMALAEASSALPLLSSGGMASQAYWSRSRARALSRAGHLANQYPLLAGRWLSGAITAEHADAAARGVARLPEDRARAVIDGLTPALGQVTPQTIAAFCARARAIVDPRPDDAELAARKAHEARFLSFSVLDDTVHITGSLARLDGELLMGTINAQAERLRVAGDGLTGAQRRADALTHLAAAAGAAGSASVVGSSAAGTSVAVSAAPISITLTAELAAVTDGGLHLPEGALRFALCDPTITPVLTEPPEAWAPDVHPVPPPRRPAPPPDDAGPPGHAHAGLAALAAGALRAPQPVVVGRTQRVATAAQRRALAIRDRGCILPGCDVPAPQCQVHHLTPWTEGGATDLPNLVSVCWAHHRQVDLGRWDIHPMAAGRSGTPANHGAPFTITLRPRSRWGQGQDQG